MSSDTPDLFDDIDIDADPPPPEKDYSLSQTHIYSPQQRNEILRDCYDRVTELESNVNLNTPDQLEPIMVETDEVFNDGTIEEKIKNMQEVVMDSQILCKATTILHKCSSQLVRGFSKYDPIEFSERILQYARRMPDSSVDGNIDWSQLGNEVIGCFNRTPKCSMLLGTLRPIPKKDVVRQKAVRQARAPIKRPENVFNVDKVEDSVEETVNGINKLIRRYRKHHNKSLDFFTLVLHPTSYGKTIENMLHTSFLIRDGFIKFKMDEDGIPHVDESPATQKDKTEQATNIRNVQNVLSLNMDQWRALVEAYGIEKPMIDLDSKKSKNTK